jgi:predicted Fe-Mo cluster-binding NifX family protein
MKIAISSQGKDLQSAVDPRFGRARYFIIFDTETNNFTVLDNNINLSAAQGAGIQTAQNISDAGVKAVLSGNVGPKAFTVLEAAGIDVYTGVNGKIGEAVESFKNGAWEKTGKPNVEGHWM